MIPFVSNPNAFSKKATFTSLITDEVRNRYLTTNEGYRLSNNSNGSNSGSNGSFSNNNSGIGTKGNLNTTTNNNKVLGNITMNANNTNMNKTNSSTSNTVTSANQSNNPPYTFDMRKKESKPKTAGLAPSEKKIIQNCLEQRGKITEGVNLLKSLLHDNSSKLSVSMCSFLAKKILTLSR